MRKSTNIVWSLPINLLIPMGFSYCMSRLYNSEISIISSTQQLYHFQIIKKFDEIFNFLVYYYVWFSHHLVMLVRLCAFMTRFVSHFTKILSYFIRAIYRLMLPTHHRNSLQTQQTTVLRNRLVLIFTIFVNIHYCNKMKHLSHWMIIWDSIIVNINHREEKH
jgi:hypothetical protein